MYNSFKCSVRIDLFYGPTGMPQIKNVAVNFKSHHITTTLQLEIRLIFALSLLFSIYIFSFFRHV